MSLRVWLPLTGTLENKGISNVTVTNSGATTDSAGKIGSCYSFVSGNKMQADFSINNSPWSVACWFYSTSSSASSHQYMVSMQANANSSGNFLFSLCLYQNRLTTRLSGTSYNSTNGAISQNVWYHGCTTYDGTNLKIYLNGNEVYSSNSVVAPTASTILILGQRIGSTGNYTGKLNDVRIYDHCLSAAEVKEISQGLVLHYKLDSFQGGFGNPNLVAGSNTTSTSTNRWGASSAVGGNTSTIVQDENGHTCVQVARDATAQSSWDYLYYSNLLRNLIKTDTTYTVSFDCKPSVDGSISFTGFLNGNATNYMTSSTSTIQGTCHANQWNHMVYRCTTKASFSDISVSGQVVYFSRSGSLRGVNTTVLFKNIKVEEGTIDTPWCPADSELTIDRTHIQDSSGYGHNGTIEGNISLDNNTPRFLSATHFQPSSGIFNNINITFDSFTISFWAKHTAQNKMLMGSNASISNKNTNWYWYGDNSFKYASGEFYYTHNAGTSEALLGTWIHFVATYDGSVITVYRNGVKEGTKTASGSMLMSYVSVGNGCTSTSYWAEGWVSDFRIYCTALSADDILSLYHTAAKVDNLGGLHTFELNENGSNKLTKNGIFKDYMVEPFMTLADGSKWQLLLYHQVNNGTNLFTSSNAGFNNGFGLYSRLNYIDNFTYDNKYEFYVIQDGAVYRWTQTNAPLTTTSVTGFTAITGSPGSGICKCNGNTLLAKTGTTSNWWNACGCWTIYNGGIPGFGSSVICKQYLILYARISEQKFKIANLSVYANNLIER